MLMKIFITLKIDLENIGVNMVILENIDINIEFPENINIDIDIKGDFAKY